MKPRTLFIIILKVFGLFFIRDILTVIPQLFSLTSFIDVNAPLQQYIGPLLTMLALLTAYILIIYFLLFKTSSVVDTLKLDKGLNQDTLQININYTAVLRIVILILAGLVLINELPNFIRFITIYFSQLSFVRGSHPDISNLAWTIAKLTVAILLIVFQKPIAGLLTRK
jgi:hypothetical protein